MLHDCTCECDCGSRWRVLCRDWGMVKHVKDQIQAQRHRPRMGKAISIMLQLNERTVQEWFS